MELATAVRLVALRTSTAHQREAYLRHMLNYVRDLKAVFPNSYTYRTCHHMAIHVYDFLKLFGPPHSWWCFPFERCIGKIQHMLTNSHFGQLEGTVTRSLIQQGNLVHWFARNECPPAVRKVQKLFSHIFMPRNKGTLDNDTAVFAADDDGESNDTPEYTKLHPGSVPISLCKAYPDLPSRVYYLSRLHEKGVVLATSAVHRGNANIIFSVDFRPSLARLSPRRPICTVSRLPCSTDQQRPAA
jgi:hypothetical protein